MKAQEALDKIMVNKSSISMAHRLDTIKNSKLIYVFEKGKVVYVETKGYFYHLDKGATYAGETLNSAK